MKTFFGLLNIIFLRVTFKCKSFFFFRDNGDYTTTRTILNEMGIQPTLIDCVHIRYICECVSRRSANLVAVGLAVLLNRINDKSVTIGVDGSVYKYHPNFHNIMEEKTRELTNPDIDVSNNMSTFLRLYVILNVLN